MITRTRTAALLASAAALLVSAAPTLAAPPGVVYHLRQGSTAQEGCSGMCACALFPAEPLRGLFILSPSTPDPVYHNFTLDSIHLRVPTLQQSFAGFGTYRYADGLPGAEQVQLDMAVNGDTTLQWFGGRRVYMSTQPILQFSASLPGNCFDIALFIKATPFVSDWNADGAITTTDIFDFLNGWFAGDGDANDDGLIATDDIFAFVNAWMAGS
jgi:hypothetical protein